MHSPIMDQLSFFVEICCRKKEEVELSKAMVISASHWVIFDRKSSRELDGLIYNKSFGWSLNRQYRIH